MEHNREWFKALLERHGFRKLPEQWWHYALCDEPWPDRYSDFSVRLAGSPGSRVRLLEGAG